MQKGVLLTEPASTKVYKYVGASYLDRVLSDDATVSLRCSYPREFNDPYELFLTIPYDVEPELLAFYAEVIGELPQTATTCFSLAPDIVPMWAHYGQGHEGAVIEFDAARLSAQFPRNGAGAIDYRDTADPEMAVLLKRALTTKKPRHTYFLQRAVMSAAYYTKSTAWAYERETRIVVDGEYLTGRGELQVLNVPNQCVTSLIAGARASETTQSILKARAGAMGTHYYQMRIGRSSPKPFFVDESAVPYTFDEHGLSDAVASCESCGEPLSGMALECSWCRIDHEAEYAAAASNPFRVLDHYGMLESYLEGMNAVERRRKD